MGISSALYSGVSGLTINGVAMNVLGNNLANTNTTGYKGSRSVFSDLLASKISGSGGISQVGRGVNMSTVDQVFNQGSFDTTESNLDCAIEGESFFVLNDPSDSDREDYYTRAGAFRFNEEGFLTSPEGYRVQGKTFDDDGFLLPGDAKDIQLINRGLVAGKISDEVTLNTNLDSRSEVKERAAAAPPLPALDPLDPKNPETYNYASAVEVFDSLGVPHLITYYFRKMDPTAPAAPAKPESRWQVYWSANDVNGMPLDANGQPYATTVNNPLTGQNYKPGDVAVNVFTGQPAPGGGAAGDPPLHFNSAGQLVDPVPGTTNIKEKTWRPLPEVNWGNGADAKQIKVIFDTTQYSSDSTVLAVDQNGYGAGSLTNVEVDTEGRIIANYSNGRQKRIAQLSLAKFVNPRGLRQKGANIYGESTESGAPRRGVSDKELGKVFTNSLERSNVDMGNEMVQVITTQRGYSANSKVITTVDEMMQEVINLKR